MSILADNLTSGFTPVYLTYNSVMVLQQNVHAELDTTEIATFSTLLYLLVYFKSHCICLYIVAFPCDNYKMASLHVLFTVDKFVLRFFVEKMVCCYHFERECAF